MKLTNGSLVLVIGSLHEIACLLAGAGVLAPPGAAPRNVFAEVVSAGFFGALAQDPTRLALFWSAWFGLGLLVLGSLMHTVEKRGERLPRSLAWQLGALALVGGLSLPASGFWLALPVAWRVARTAGKGAARQNANLLARA